MGLLSLLFTDPFIFFVLLVLLLYSVIAHEVAHGWVASLFGDKTALYSGRLTLNPKMHIDPIGALMLLIAGFGWAKPVPVNYNNLRNHRLGVFCVALAGSLTNLILATCALLLLQFPLFNYNFLGMILGTFAHINIVLGAFNLIPFPPLDGSKILMAFLPVRIQYKLARFEPYGLIVLVVLIYARVLDPVIEFFSNTISFLIGSSIKLFT